MLQEPPFRKGLPGTFATGLGVTWVRRGLSRNPGMAGSGLEPRDRQGDSCPTMKNRQ